MRCVFIYFRYYYFAREGNQQRFQNKRSPKEEGYGKMVRQLDTCDACAWLMKGMKSTVGKDCVGKFCSQHNFQLKNGIQQPVPCRYCRSGIFVSYRVCRPCGGKVVCRRLIYKEKRLGAVLKRFYLNYFEKKLF